VFFLVRRNGKLLLIDSSNCEAKITLFFRSSAYSDFFVGSFYEALHFRGTKKTKRMSDDDPKNSKEPGVVRKEEKRVKRARWGARHRIHEFYDDDFPLLGSRFARERDAAELRYRTSSLT